MCVTPLLSGVIRLQDAPSMEWHDVRGEIAGHAAVAAGREAAVRPRPEIPPGDAEEVARRSLPRRPVPSDPLSWGPVPPDPVPWGAESQRREAQAQVLLQWNPRQAQTQSKSIGPRDTFSWD